MAETKLFIACTIAFAVVFYTFFAECVISSFSEHLSGTNDVQISEVVQFQGPFKTVVSGLPLHSVGEKIEDDNKKGISVVPIKNKNSMRPPLNGTEEERIQRFRRKLPEMEIFKSDNLTEEFHGRVLEFTRNDCEIQFFMTWIAPAESFRKRELLALESLFNIHPRGCLIILSRTLDSSHGHRTLKPLMDLGLKVAAVTPNLSFLFSNTPAESWLNELMTGKQDPGKIPLSQNLSNIIRLAVLYKYGGVYLDTDFIVLKSFLSLRNSIGAQSIIDDESKNWKGLNNAVLVFDRNHPLVFKFIEEFASNFNGNIWGHNGPRAVSGVVRALAESPGYKHNFSVLPPIAFYPIHWSTISDFFKRPEGQASSRWVEEELLQLSKGSYGVHLWNKKSKRLKVEEGSVLARLMSDHCLICKNIYSF